MNREVRSFQLYDAAQVLAQTLEKLDMSYEVRGFGTRSAH